MSLEFPCQLLLYIHIRRGSRFRGSKWLVAFAEMLNHIRHVQWKNMATGRVYTFGDRTLKKHRTSKDPVQQPTILGHRSEPSPPWCRTVYVYDVVYEPFIPGFFYCSHKRYSKTLISPRRPGLAFRLKETAYAS